MNKLAIVIPAHNEEKRIEVTLKNYFSYFENLEKRNILNFQIIVVLNACQDKTKEIVEKYVSKNLKILDFETPGKGFAIVQGFLEAIKKDFDLIGFVDADFATPPEAFYSLFKNIANFDGIIANRWDKKSLITLKQTILRRILSRGYNIAVRSLFLFRYRDTQCGAKLFKKEILQGNIEKIVSSEWGFDVALLFCLKKEGNAKIRSIPTIWNDKKESHINLKKTPINMFLSLIRLRLVHSPFKFVVRFYRKLPENLKFHRR